MSEEKMRAAFKRVKGCEMKDAMACAARDFEDGWKAAIKFVNTNSESEAGAVPFGYLDRQQLERWERLRGTKYAAAEIGYIGFSKEPFETDLTDCTAPVFLAPPSAQAIETAAIMKCAAIIKAQDIDPAFKLRMASAIESLFPEDDRTQLASLLAEHRKQALLRAAEICDQQYARDRPLQEAGGQDNSDNYVTGYIDGCSDCGNRFRRMAEGVE